MKFGQNCEIQLELRNSVKIVKIFVKIVIFFCHLDIILDKDKDKDNDKYVHLENTFKERFFETFDL